MDAVTNVPQPVNEPVHDYAPGSRNGRRSPPGWSRWLRSMSS